MPWAGGTDAVSSLAFAANGKTLASGSWDGSIKLWHLATFQELLSLDGHTGKVRSLAFSPDGTVLATCGETPQGGGEVLIWRATIGSP